MTGKNREMDLLGDNVGRLYFKYISAAFASIVIVTLYASVDTIVIGRYEGPDGSAATAAYSPMWAIIYAIGLLFGIGGSVLSSRSMGAGDSGDADGYFSAAVILGGMGALFVLVLFSGFSRQMLYLFGGRDDVLDLACIYGRSICWAAPVFVLCQVILPFIRSDGHPLWATVAVAAGGILNIFGDIYFVFGLGMGVFGAGLSTALSQCVTMILVLLFFVCRKNHLHFCLSAVRGSFMRRGRQIVATGISIFVVDITLGVFSVIANNQIIKYTGSVGLTVFGIISSIVTVVQVCGYSIGESGQAIISANFGAGKMERVFQARNIITIVSFAVGMAFAIVTMIFPRTFISLYTNPTPEVLEMGVHAFRMYFFSLVFRVFNVSATYYFQSVGLAAKSFAISLTRGVLLCGILVMVLPKLVGADGIWITIPLTEFAVSFYIAGEYLPEIAKNR